MDLDEKKSEANFQKSNFFFPSSNNGVFAAREFNHMANNHVLPYPNV